MQTGMVRRSRAGIRKEKRGGLLSKREHMLHRDEVREMELESSHISSCCIILCFDLLSI